MIFDSVDLSLSYLSITNSLSDFDQIPKDLSKIPYFPVDSTLIYHYTPQIGKFGCIVDTNRCVINNRIDSFCQRFTRTHVHALPRGFALPHQRALVKTLFVFFLIILKLKIELHKFKKIRENSLKLEKS